MISYTVAAGCAKGQIAIEHLTRNNAGILHSCFSQYNSKLLGTAPGLPERSLQMPAQVIGLQNLCCWGHSAFARKLQCSQQPIHRRCQANESSRAAGVGNDTLATGIIHLQLQDLGKYLCSCDAGTIKELHIAYICFQCQFCSIIEK